MTNFEQLKQQIQLLSPEQQFSEIELTIMANDLIRFFATVVQTIQELGAK